MQPGNEACVRPFSDAYLDQAEAHLTAVWAYPNQLPRRSVRVRLACAWPLLIGRQTLDLLRTGRVLDPNHRLKVNRRAVRRILCRTIFFYPWPARWEQLFIATAATSEAH